MLTVVDIIKLMLKFVNIWYVNQHGPVWSRMVINVLKLIIFICRKLLYYSVIIPYDPDQGSGNGVQDVFVIEPLLEYLRDFCPLGAFWASWYIHSKPIGTFLSFWEILEKKNHFIVTFWSLLSLKQLYCACSFLQTEIQDSSRVSC